MESERLKAVGFLREMTAILAPSGAEEPMIDYMRNAFRGAGTAVRVDPLGNVVACVRQEQHGEPVLMILAHMDQVGLVVRKIEPTGFLRVYRLGGIPEKSLACQRVIVLGNAGPVSGLIGTKAHHVTKPEEKYHVVPVEEIYIDISRTNTDDVAQVGVNVGNYVIYEPRFYLDGDLVQATSLDNRAGCTALVMLAERLAGRSLSAGIYLVGSVQEEFNLRGILPAVRSIKPTAAVAVDIAVTNDTPDLNHLGDLRLGGGPAVSFFSFHGRGELNGVLPNPKLSRFVLDMATKQAIPVQRTTIFGGLTDAAYVQLEGQGVPSIEIGIPARYSHAPIEACAVSDVIKTVDLLEAVVAGFTSDLNLSRGS